MNSRKLWIGLLIIIGFLEVAYVAAFKMQIMLQFFDLNGEANLPAWSTSITLAIAGFLALLTYLLHEKGEYFWLVLSAACFFISLDEIVQIHEQLTLITHIKWIFYYAPIGSIVLAYLTWRTMKIRDHHPHVKTIMQGVFIGFILATGLETLSHFGLASLWQKVEYMLEEGAEMLGADMILIGCLQELIPSISSTERHP